MTSMYVIRLRTLRGGPADLTRDGRLKLKRGPKSNPVREGALEVMRAHPDQAWSAHDINRERPELKKNSLEKALYTLERDKAIELSHTLIRKNNCPTRYYRLRTPYEGS